jgi:hypothetical protein
MHLIEQGGLTLLLSEPLMRVPRVTHAFTTRAGGYSQRTYAGLNLSFDVGDDRQDVQRNRLTLARVLGLDNHKFVTPSQKLTNIVSIYDHNSGQQRVVSDGIVTRHPDVILMTESADCALVLLCDPVTGAIGNLHASWRGTLQEISLVGVQTMQRSFGSDPKDIFAAISPSIGPCCFEVKQDVIELFERRLGYSARFFLGQRTRVTLDLKGLNRYQLIQAGLLARNIDVATICTKCGAGQPDPSVPLFYSYRRDGRTGRFAAVIAITP